MMPTPTELAAVPVGTLTALHGRTAVITGGGRGIGLAIAHRLAEAGASVVIGDSDEDAAGRAAAELQTRWRVPAHAFACDVTDATSVDALADFGDSLGDGLHVWVNNAGVYPQGSIVDMTDESWKRVLGITLDGTMYGCRAAARKMLGRPELRGRVILNVSSLSGLRGRANLSSYVAAKHGVSGLVRALAVELGASGIRVVGLAPGVTDTPGMRLRDVAGTLASSVGNDAGATSRIPLGRSAAPDDVARAALYLVSDFAEYISGVILPVDGGSSAA